MLNSPDLSEATNECRSVTHCLTDLIRTGKDAQMILEPIRSFCRFVGYDEDAVRQGVCDESSTFAALVKHVDALHHLFEHWNEPAFPDLVPEALMHLKRIHKVVDNGIFCEHVGTWNIAWTGLYNAVASKKCSAAHTSQNE
ncbi:MAG: hypothetical protein HYX68_27070 [Planctomycetes bacterium]|nr:hypothetical protein [Planctomycetota bacterium]